MRGTSDLESGGKQYADGEQEARAVMGEEIQVHWQVMLNSLTSKPGPLEGRQLGDAECFLSCHNVGKRKHPYASSLVKGSGKSQREDLCRGMGALPSSPRSLGHLRLGGWVKEMTGS